MKYNMAIKFLKGIINFCKGCKCPLKDTQLKGWSEINNFSTIHLLLQKSLCFSSNIIFFENLLFWKQKSDMKNAKMTDFKRFHLSTKRLFKMILSCKTFSKSSRNDVFPILNSLGIPQLTISSSPVRRRPSLPCLPDNEKRAVSAQSTKKQPDFVSLNCLCEEPMATFP